MGWHCRLEDVLASWRAQHVIDTSKAPTVRKSSHPTRLDIDFAHNRRHTKTTGSMRKVIARMTIILFE